MSLSCNCEYDYDLSDVEWLWYAPGDYSTLETKRARRCCSCGTRITPGETVAKFSRVRAPNAIEERIYGEDAEMPIASWFHCETCADLFFSITALGFCIDIGDDMRVLVKEYAEHYRPTMGSVSND